MTHTSDKVQTYDLSFKHQTFKNIFILAILLLTFASKALGQQPLKVILIRHAEKPLSGDNLSCKGWNRALALAAVLHNKFGLPDAIFVPAPNCGKTTKSLRMLQTIQPFATRYNLPLNTSCSVTQPARLAKKILAQTGTVLVVWEHNELAAIVKLLGVTTAPSWPGNDFDSIWIVEYKNGTATLHQDKENIQPKDNCLF